MNPEMTPVAGRSGRTDGRIRSMTGYGAARGVCAGLDLRVEVRSVNNRYLDCAVRMPRNLLFAEEAVKARVQERIARGKVDVFITLEGMAAEQMEVRVNEGLVLGYARAVTRAAELLGLEPELSPMSLCRFPEVLSLEKTEVAAEEFTAALGALTEQAVLELDSMRLREGEKLRADIATRLEDIVGGVAEVERRSPEIVSAYRERLYRKMCEVLERSDIDPQRILLEAGLFADKVSVDEETVRLRSHVEQMRGFLESGSPIGRKMDFLVQELNREANTIGSKCSDGATTQVVIELKSDIEKIREQVQNIE